VQLPGMYVLCESNVMSERRSSDFTNVMLTAKFVKILLCKSFPLYGTLMAHILFSCDEVTQES
jgi:hypothetical protein